MHELAITESLVEYVSARAEGGRIVRVVVEVGALTGVAADALRACFELCAAGTVAEGAELDVVTIGGAALCECGRETNVDCVVGVCACGRSNLHIVRGNELKIREMEVV